MFSEGFFFEWFHGPFRVSGVYRELAYTVGVSKGFSRNNFLDWFSAFLEARKLNGRENLYLSIGFYRDPGFNPEYHYLYFDFDSENIIEFAREEAQQFIQYLRDRFSCDPVIVFSGCKGYNVIVPLDRPVDFNIYRVLCLTLTSPFTFHTLDSKVLDPRRVHRIPYTYNVKPGRKGLAQILKSDFTPMRPEDFSWENYGPLKLNSVKIYRIEVDLPKVKVIYHAGSRPRKPLPNKIEDLASSDLVPPCIRNVVEAMVKSGELDHYQRMGLVLYLKWIGFQIDDVIEFFRKYANDFNERIARYQVEYLYGLRGKKEDWLMFSCRKMKQLGICLECGWNRNPVTYTYRKAAVNNEVKQRFYSLTKGKPLLCRSYHSCEKRF